MSENNNKYILGLDISTSCLGYCIMRDDKKLSELNYINFRDNLSIFEKFDEFKKNTEHFFKLDIKRVAIEEPLKRFKGKFSSAHTIAILNFFNGMISSYLYNIKEIEPIYYNVNTARSVVFYNDKISSKKESSVKHAVWERIFKMEPQINWKYNKKGELKKENYDMCDAYVVSLANIYDVEKRSMNKQGA